MKEKPSVLVVDDQPLNVKLLEAHLAPQGYEIYQAYSGQEALEKVLENEIDLILLDVMMPGLDGYEVTRRLRANEETRLIPIVLITALKDTEDRIRGIEAGCDDFISKSFDKNELLSRVKALLKISYYRSLLDEKEKFEYLIEHMEDGIVIFSGDIKINRLNQKARDFLGIDTYDPDFDFFNHLESLFKVNYQGDLKKDVKERMLSFSLERSETEKVKSLFLEVRSSVIKNPAKEISSLIMIVNDVTEQRKEELLKQNFLSLISHKLRTPVNFITQSASMLREGILGSLTEKQEKFINSILEKSNSLAGLVEKLIGFTTVISQNIDLLKDSVEEPIELKSYLTAFIDSRRYAREDKKVEITIDCPEQEASISLSKSYLDLIMGNLIENAIKFNDKESAKITVAVKTFPEKIDILVSDNGAGIPPEEKEKIFNKFYQIDKYFTGNVEGAGLGLALVKQLITAYGGQMDLKSEIGRGSTFTISLPSSLPSR